MSMASLTIFLFVVVLLILGLILLKNLDEWYYHLALLPFGIALILLPVGGAQFMQDSQACEWQNNYTSTIYKYGNNFTGYHWDYDAGTAPSTVNPNDVAAYVFHTYDTQDFNYNCNEPTSTGKAFYKATLWFTRILGTLLFVFWLFSLFREKKNET